jgi:histidine triad (HIT) family protein
MDRFASDRTPAARAARPCTFCEIAAGRLPAHIVLETEACVGFLDRSPLLIGHVLLVPRAHIVTLPEADDAVLTDLALDLRALTAAMPTALGAAGTFVAQNNVVSQSVPHLHFHVVPRWRDDKLFSHSLTWKRVRYADEAQAAETAMRIRQALGAVPQSVKVASP